VGCLVLPHMPVHTLRCIRGLGETKLSVTPSLPPSTV
jgi:hypothetical protein